MGYNESNMKGGTDLTPKSAPIIRYIGLLAPIVLLAYGALIALDFVGSRNHIDTTVLVGISTIWLAVGIWQFLQPGGHEKSIAIRLTFYHLLSSMYLLFITGMSTPFTAAWIILLVVAGIYFGALGVWLSLGIFTATILLDIIIWEGTHTAILQNVAVLIAVLFSGIIAMTILRLQRVDREEIAESHERENAKQDEMLTTINSITDGVISIDQGGLVKMYNSAALDLLDTNKDLTQHHIDEVLPLIDESGGGVETWKLISTNKTVHTYEDLRYSVGNDEQIRLEIVISPIHKAYRNAHSDHGGYILILRDITKAKSLEEERDEFISVVSHELRTPITIVEGTLSNLAYMMDKLDVDKDTIQEQVNAAHSQTLFLAKMMNDLSTLSRAERGIGDDTEVIDVKELGHKLFEEYQASAAEKGLKLNLDLDSSLGEVETSRLYLEELLQDFITNAIKYTKKGSVTIKFSKKQKNVTFAITDTGIGVSKTDQAKIFEKFYRSEDYRTRETGGTGLGLYVAAKLAKKLTTKIHLQSRLNHGSTFSFTLTATDK